MYKPHLLAEILGSNRGCSLYTKPLLSEEVNWLVWTRNSIQNRPPSITSTPISSPRYYGGLARQMANRFVASHYLYGVFVHVVVKISFSKRVFLQSMASIQLKVFLNTGMSNTIFNVASLVYLSDSAQTSLGILHCVYSSCVIFLSDFFVGLW